MKVTLKRWTADPDLICGEAAALCYNGKNPEKSLQVAMKGGHESVLEHASFTFLIEDVSRVLLAQCKIFGTVAAVLRVQSGGRDYPSEHQGQAFRRFCYADDAKGDRPL